MRHIVDVENWDRKDNFKFFENFLNPFYTITSRVECSTAMQRAKERGESLFLHYLYALLKAVNNVEAFKYRVEGANFEEVVYYDKVDMLTPIAVEQGTFFTIRLEYTEDFQAFLANAHVLIEQAKAGGNPYAVDAELAITGRFNVVLLSTMPHLQFTSASVAQKHRHGSDYPMFFAGKISKEQLFCESTNKNTVKAFMPLGVAAHHGLVDGAHISEVFQKMEQFLQEGF